MATFEATIHPLTFALMEGGSKTIYVAPIGLGFDHITAGDRLEFPGVGSITVGAIRKYPELQELLELEGVTNVVPDAPSVEDAMKVLREGPEWDVSKEKSGVVAMRVRWTKRKS